MRMSILLMPVRYFADSSSPFVEIDWLSLS